MTIRILAYDIETKPLNAYTWGLFDQNIGLNQIVEPGAVMSFAARWYGDPKRKIVFRSDFHDGHEGMVRAAWDLFDEADAFLSWNGAAFDTKHMNREFLLAGLGKPSPTKEIDLLRTARSQFKFASNKLEHVASQVLGTGKVKHSGFELWTRCMAGDPKAWAQMSKYNRQDVHLLIDLYEVLRPWIPGHPNVKLYDDQLTEGCHACPQTDHHKKNGTYRTAVGRYQRYQCLDCGAYYSSGQRLDGVDTRGTR